MHTREHLRSLHADLMAAKSAVHAARAAVAAYQTASRQQAAARAARRAS